MMPITIEQMNFIARIFRVQHPFFGKVVGWAVPYQFIPYQFILIRFKTLLFLVCNK